MSPPRSPLNGPTWGLFFAYGNVLPMARNRFWREWEAAWAAIWKQRGVLRDWKRPTDEIRRPYKMTTREFTRRIGIIHRNEERALKALMGITGCPESDIQ